MKNKKLVIFNYFLMHYHVARCRAAYEVGQSMGWDVKTYYGKPLKSSFPLCDYSSFLSDQATSIIQIDSDLGSAYQHRAVGQQTVDYLDMDNPDAVAILGYNTHMDWSALGWCRRQHKGAILMSESQSVDFPRSVLREFFKSKIISLFDSALVGGKPHVEYAKNLGISPERIFTGYDVVDNDFWSKWADRVQKAPEHWREHLNLPGHFFLTASRLIPKKNVAGLLHSYAHYCQVAENPWPLVIVGDGPLRVELEGLARSLNVAEQVRFMGYLSADEMGPVYALASVFILASAYSEQWGLVVNEAMASGLPVLVSRICGCVPDLVIDGVTGYSFDPADENALAHLLTQCSDGGLDLNQLGHAAQEHIQAYSPQIFAENLIASAQAAIEHASKRFIDGWPLPLVLP